MFLARVTGQYSRMGALLTSVLIEQQVGIETVTHYACRDRNLLGMLSDLLGASAVGLRNLLLIDRAAGIYSYVYAN